MATIRQPRYKTIFKGAKGGAKMAERAAVIWAEVRSHLEENGLVTKRRLALADRYVRACVEYEHLYPDAIKEGPR